MGKATTAKALLLTATQDLYDAECALRERLSEPVKASSDETLVAALTDYAEAAAKRADGLSGIAEALDGKAKDAPNIWMRAVLDDAARDANTVEPGPLLDIALVGAIRKGAQAARVSYETALALAGRAKRKAMATEFEGMRDAHSAMDRRLAARLRKLVAGLD